jgi:hypothetical protein
MSNKPVELKKDGYTVQIGYSPEAVEKKLMKFVSKSGDEFIISSDEMISILMNQVNMDTLEPTFVDTEKINVVEVSRQIKVVLEEDMKKGKEINLNYVHPYPLEFALIEEAYKIAKVEEGGEVRVLTKEFLEDVRKKITPQMEHYVKKFYESFKNIKIPPVVG